MMDGTMNKLAMGARLRRAGATLALAALLAFAPGCAAGHDNTWLLAKPELQESGACSLQLSEKQLGSCEKATYNVLVKYISGYYPVLLDVPAEIDGSGAVIVPADIRIPVATSAEGEPLLLLGATCESAENGVRHYRIDGFRLAATAHLGPAGLSSALQDCRVQMDVSDESEVVDFSIARDNPPYPLAEELPKSELSLYHGISYVCGLEYGKTRAEDGSIAPVSQWERNGMTSGRSHVYEGSFGIAMIPLSDTDGQFYVQVEATDADGAVHASDIAELPVSKPDGQGVIQVETEHGVMTFGFDGKSARLESYEGEDERVEVPAKAGGLPVTEIGYQAFCQNEYIREVTLPNTITSIGHEAFRGTKIRSFAIPPKLASLGSAVFSRTPYLESFVQNEPNALTSVQDGVLFSADGKALLAYPSAKGETYQIPDGVEVVGYAAFASSGIADVSFPETVTQIEPAAFIDCRNLARIELPASLERLGAAAFGEGAPSMTAQEDAYSDVSSVHIGPKVRYIGAEAFNGTRLEEIEVDPDNKWYRSIDGLLVSSDGELVMATRTLPGALEIPEGVTAIADGSLDMVGNEGNGKLDLFLPASLERIGQNALPVRTESDGFSFAEGIPSVNAVFHAPAGSWAESYAVEHGIEHDNARDADVLRYAETTVDTPTGTFGFRVYGDHASLVSIQANDAGHMEVPEQVEGKPVTRIGEPEAAETSGIVKTFILPATVEAVQEGYLSRISGLRKFEVAEGGRYTTRDGCLYNADGTTLVAYPQARGESYTVPEGTLEIGAGAFEGSGVVSVALPNGVERIANRAFQGTSSLTAIELPSSLKSIGEEAFSMSGIREINLPDGLETVARNAFQNTAGSEGLRIPDSVTAIGYGAFEHVSSEEATAEARTLHIGAGLERLEAGAFAGLDIDGFSVSPGNKHLKADGPFLLSKDGRVLHACASGASGEVAIPEGVEEIETYAFWNLSRVTDISIPDSVLRISSIAFDYGSSDGKPLIHCAAGSEAEFLVQAYGLNFTTGADSASDSEPEPDPASDSGSAETQDQVE